VKPIFEVQDPVTRPERILQYGEGNFLRAFVDWQVDLLNEKTDFNGNVVMVQPLEIGMGTMINAQKGLYTTLLRGFQEGKAIKELRTIHCVSRCLNPFNEEDYQKYLDLAGSPDLRFIFSNTTEEGIAYHKGESLEEQPQFSFPGKVCAFLYRRFEIFKGDRGKGMIVIPCELIDANGDTLKKIVKQYADEWNLGKAFSLWLDEACDFCNSLVDRIVQGYPKEEALTLHEKLGYTDNLLVSAEIFHLWVIESHKSNHEKELPLKEAGLNVVWTDNMRFYRNRKISILNGAHTLTALAAYQSGLDTVEECTKDSQVLLFMKNGIFKEILPSMESPDPLLDKYANEVLERFANPFLHHRLLEISLNSTSKYKTRDLPSLLVYIDRYNKLPKRLVFALAALISFYEGTEFDGPSLKGTRNGETYLIEDSYGILSRFAELYTLGGDAKRKAKRLSEGILGESSWWGQDLTEVTGLADAVCGYLVQIWTKGMKETLKSLEEEDGTL
jgi:tagaturonate reductase